MKKLIMFILIFSMSFVYGDIDLDKRAVEITGLEVDGEFAEIKASNDSLSAYKNGKYKDVSNENLSKLGSFGVVKNESGEINLSDKISKLNVLKYLVILNGNNNAVMNRVKPQIENKKDNLVQSIENKEYIKEAINIGIITNEEAVNLKDNINNMHIAKYLFNMLNLDEKTEYSYKDYKEVNKSNRGIYEAVVSEKIMELDSEGNFNEAKEIDKETVFDILNNAFERVYNKSNIVKNEGIVLGNKKDTIDKTSYSIDTEEVLIKNIDGSLTKVLKENDPKNGVRDFVVFKNNTLNMSNVLSAGDQIVYYTKDGDVLYAEVLDDGSILNQISNLNSADDTFLYFGTVLEKSVEKEYINNKKYKTDRVRVSVNDFSLFDIIVKEDVKTGIKNDIIVYKNNKVGGVDLLRKGDRVELLLKDGKNVVYVKVKTLQNKYLKGTIKEVGKRSLTILDYSNNLITYPALEYANITINKERNYLNKLKKGMEAQVYTTNGYITAVNVDTFLNPGYIRPNSKMSFGTVSHFNEYSIKMRNDNKTYSTVDISKAKLIKGGNTVRSSSLKEGDKIKVYYSDINSNKASIVEIEGKESLVTDIYKGVIKDIDRYTNEIIIKNPYTINNFKWKSKDEYTKRFMINKHADIYADGTKITLRELAKYYRDKDVYIVAKDNYSKAEATQINIKSGSERFRVDRVKNVDNVVKNMKLFDSNQNVSYNEGTVFIKNSRIVEESNINENDDILLVSDYTPSGEHASIVNIVPKREEFFNNIYIGAIEDIYSSMFTLTNYSYVRNNRFNRVESGESSYFFYPSDLMIRDLTDKKEYKDISAYDLYHGGYSRVENKNETEPGLSYYRYYTFFVTDDNENIIGMNIRKKGLVYLQDIDSRTFKEENIKKELDQTIKSFMFTKGVLKAEEPGDKRIKLTDSYTWVDRYNSWNANKKDVDLEYKDAIFIKNNKKIDIEDVSIGDSLFILRDDEDALVIYVE